VAAAIVGSVQLVPKLITVARRFNCPEAGTGTIVRQDKAARRAIDSPAVLVPRLDLGVRQAELGRQFHPILDAQVLLSFKALLQGLQLVVGEGRPRLALLLGQSRGASAPSR